VVSKEKTFDMCLKEMFRRVGRPTVDENFIRREHWYRESSWTEAEEKDFKDWMVRLIRRRHKWTKRLAVKEVSWFLLSYSWKYVPDGCMKVLGGRVVK
jgi:mannosyltransferase OCH1-like enzyme